MPPSHLLLPPPHPVNTSTAAAAPAKTAALQTTGHRCHHPLQPLYPNQQQQQWHPLLVSQVVMAVTPPARNLTLHPKATAAHLLQERQSLTLHQHQPRPRHPLSSCQPCPPPNMQHFRRSRPRQIPRCLKRQGRRWPVQLRRKKMWLLWLR